MHESVRFMNALRCERVSGVLCELFVGWYQLNFKTSLITKSGAARRKKSSTNTQEPTQVN